MEGVLARKADRPMKLFLQRQCWRVVRSKVSLKLGPTAAAITTPDETKQREPSEAATSVELS